MSGQVRRWDPASRSFRSPEDPAIVAVDAAAAERRAVAQAESNRIWQAAAVSIRAAEAERAQRDADMARKRWARETGRPVEEF